MATKNPNGIGTYYKRIENGKVRFCWMRILNGKKIQLSAYSQSKLKEKIKKFETNLANTGYKENVEILSEFIDRYLERRKPVLKQHTYDTYKVICKLFLKNRPLGNKKIASITPTMVQDYLNELSKTYSSVYVGDIRRCLNLILNGAIVEGLINVNPCSFAKPPRQRTREVVVLNEEQIRILLEEAKTGNYFKSKFMRDNDGLVLLRHQFYVCLLLTIFTGMRRGESFGLSWDNVNLEENTIRVVQALSNNSRGLCLEDPKTSSSIRTIVVPDFVNKALKAWKKEQQIFAMKYSSIFKNKNNLVFTNTYGSLWNINNVNKRYWHRLRKACNLPKSFKWHWLRHTHASMLIKHGVPIPEITRRLGHSSSAVTLKVYSHAFKNDESRAISALEAMWTKTELLKQKVLNN